MESITPTTPLESVQQLDVYLESLGDFRSALVGFERLADLVLASDECSQSSPDCSSAAVFSAPFSVAFQAPSSPGGQSNASSVNCCASCTSNWPGATPSSSSAFSSSSASSVVSYSQCSSNLSSRLSSSCKSSLAGGDCGSSSSSLSWWSSSLRGEGGGRRSARPAESRRKKNASAAERYRKKLKGRRSGLEGELEQELERNSKLRRSLEAKLESYREFADLLAQNTRDERDCELADLGSRSLATILDTVWPTDGRQRAQLEQLLAHFRLVQEKAGSASSSNSALASESDEFECDFYDDRLVLAPQVH